MSNQLIPNTLSGIPTVSSLEIAEILGKEHSHVMRDIKNTLEQAEIGASKFGDSYISAQGKSLKCYLLPRLECDLVTSGYSVKYRLAIIKRWYELEAKEIKQSFELPTTFSGALLLASQQAQVIEEQQAQLAIAAPKEKFFDKVTASKTVCQIAVACHLAKLPFGRNTLFRKLREEGIFIAEGNRKNLPKQQYINQDLFQVNESCYDHPKTGAPIIAFTAYVTQKGLDWLSKRYQNCEPEEIESIESFLA